MSGEGESVGTVELLWIPLGAGHHVVRLSGRAFERVSARRQRREPCALFHSALLVTSPEGRHVIEQAPELAGEPSGRGVVGGGPVGLEALGRLRVFRYEVRCWRGGVIPDAEEAVGGPVRLADDLTAARRVLDAVAEVPTPVWGRDELGAGEMWNSNSVVAWVLCRSGLDVADLRPPGGGRAPGWAAGVVVAGREGTGPPAPPHG